MKTEWLEARRKGIGGSDIAAIAGLSPWKSPLAIYMDKRGELPPTPDNERMMWGRKLEDVVARHFAEVNDVKVHRVNRMLQHPAYPMFLANLDRLIVSPKAVLEIKTGSARAAQGWQEGEIPSSYELQARWYMLVADLKEAWLAALLGGQEYVQVHLNRDKEIEDYLIQIALDFWKMVEDGTPPDPTHQDTDLLKALHPKAQPISIILPDESKALLDRRHQLKVMADDYAQQLQEVDNKLLAQIGEAEVAYVGEEVAATWKTQTRTSVDGKRLKAEMPEVFEQYLKTSSYRVLRVKE